MGRLWRTIRIVGILCLAIQNIALAAPIKDEFRFEHLENAKFVYIKEGSFIKEEQRRDSANVGKTKKISKAYVLEECSEQWIYVESGKVRGFIEKSCLVSSNSIQEIYQYKGKGEMDKEEILLEPYENQAFTYRQITVKKTVVKKRPVVAKRSLAVYETKNLEKSRIVGTMEEGAVAYILADGRQKIIYIESGDVRGFVDRECFVVGKRACNMIKKAGESISFAKKLVEPEQNRACYYTLTSTEEARTEVAVRKEIVDFALQFVGNPYVWGGTSLTDGADCSGFVQSIYGHFGYSIPRVTTEQVGCGTRITLAEANPGDLIFYQRTDGYIYHVSMYIGEGRVVHAANSKSGIITGEIWGDAVCAIKLIE